MEIPAPLHLNINNHPMKPTNLIISIPEPCHEDWNKMQPDEKGKFCSVCQTSVIDFTNKTTDEIALYFQVHIGEKKCGIFKSCDVKTDNKIDNLITFLYSKKLKFIAVFITGLLILTGCKTKKHTGTTYGGPRFLDKKTNSIESVK